MANPIGENQGMLVPDEFVCRAIPQLAEPEAPNGKTARNGPNVSQEIEFPDAYYRVFDRNCFAFPAYFQGREIRCIVPIKSLVDRFGAKAVNLKQAEPVFLQVRTQLQTLATSLILANRAPPDEVVIG